MQANLPKANVPQFHTRKTLTFQSTSVFGTSRIKIRMSPTIDLSPTRGLNALSFITILFPTVKAVRLESLTGARVPRVEPLKSKARALLTGQSEECNS